MVFFLALAQIAHELQSLLRRLENLCPKSCARNGFGEKCIARLCVSTAWGFTAFQLPQDQVQQSHGGCVGINKLSSSSHKAVHTENFMYSLHDFSKIRFL